MTDKSDLKELVLEGRKKGKVVFLQYTGNDFAVMSEPVTEFIDQPVDGILYDLNRLEEIALTYMDDPKWVNDFAVALTIRALKEEQAALEQQVERYEGALEKIAQWSEAYPLDVFPEPDLEKAQKLLKAVGGMTLDAISASNMRHVVEGVGGIAKEALATEEET